MIHKVCYFLLFLVILTACSKEPTRQSGELLEQHIDSVLDAQGLSRTSKVDSLEKILKTIKKDTLRIEMMLHISYSYSRGNDAESFRYWNGKSRKLAIELKDSFQLADSYWDLALFYDNENKLDSSFAAYKKAYDLYTLINEPVYAGRILLNMAIIQKNVGDYTGSEIASFKAIELLKNSGRNKNLYSAYNNLGIVYNSLEEYQKSLDHHTLALSYLKKMDPSSPYKEISLNNVGVVLQNMGRHREALQNYTKALSTDSLLIQRSHLYAMLLDNHAYSRMALKDTTGVLKDYLKALEIREDIESPDGIVINKIHLGEYYALKKDTARAIALATEANVLARKTKNSRDALASFKLLARLDHRNAAARLNDYIRLNDSLQREERATRNKFTKIRFETDEFIAENKKLYGQRKVLIGLSFGIALLGLSGFIIKNQRTKNRELVLRQDQQEANEQIFRLVLDQQNIKEEGRQKERKRLSEELHDGILAKLFGLRLSLTSLNSRADEAAIAKREEYLEDLRELGKEIRQLSHELNSPLFTAGTGYVSILEEVLSRQQEENPFTYKLQIEEGIDWEKIPGSIKLHLLRILQEAVKNIQKHSAASFVNVSLRLQEKTLSFSIKDNGAGFDTNIKKAGIGLKNMESRTKAMKGKIKISSHLKKGTKIKIQVPL